jgi:hypothetical protein
VTRNDILPDRDQNEIENDLADIKDPSELEKEASGEIEAGKGQSLVSAIFFCSSKNKKNKKVSDAKAESDKLIAKEDDNQI